MMSIKARGGVGVAQSPDSAAAPEMPNSVISKVSVDHVVHPLELPGLLARLAHSEAPATRRPDPPQPVRQLEGGEPGTPVDLVCPLCQGVLTEAQAGAVEHFRCHVGHTFSLESLVREHGEEMERALWAAVRALEEGATLSGRLASQEKNAAMQKRFREKQETQAQQAHVIREILLRGMRLGRDDANRLSEEGAAGPGPRE
jgi:two-component system chemotaxis response regulator CheB